MEPNERKTSLMRYRYMPETFNGKSFFGNLSFFSQTLTLELSQTGIIKLAVFWDLKKMITSLMQSKLVFTYGRQVPGTSMAKILLAMYHC